MKKLVLSVVMAFAIVAFLVSGVLGFIWCISTPEVHQSWSASLHGETKIISVIARDGRELLPNSQEAKRILKGPHEIVWVD